MKKQLLCSTCVTNDALVLLIICEVPLLLISLGIYIDRTTTFS